MSAESKLWMRGKTLNRLVNGHQISLCHLLIFGIFQVPTMLQGHVLFCPLSNDNLQTHARAAWRILSKVEAS